MLRSLNTCCALFSSDLRNNLLYNLPARWQQLCCTCSVSLLCAWRSCITAAKRHWPAQRISSWQSRYSTTRLLTLAGVEWNWNCPAVIRQWGAKKVLKKNAGKSKYTEVRRSYVNEPIKSTAGDYKFERIWRLSYVPSMTQILILLLKE